MPCKAEDDRIAEKTARRLREMTTAEYYELFYLLRNPKKLIWLNFLIGISRGVGFAIGLTVLGGIVIALTSMTLRKMVSAPLIGQYISDIVTLVRANMNQ